MKESRKEFILQAHNEACTDWKTKIEKEFPKLFKETELVVGKWYKLTEHYCDLSKGSVFPFVGYQGDFRRWSVVGHSIFSEDTRDFSAPPSNTLTPATDEEVETALINEAKKRGFKEGVTIKGMGSSRNRTLDKGGFKTLKSNNVLWWGSGSFGYDVFKKGKWATIIEQKTDLTVAQIEEKLGYSVNVVKG